MNTHPIPPAPELKDLASYLDKLMRAVKNPLGEA